MRERWQRQDSQLHHLDYAALGQREQENRQARRQKAYDTAGCCWKRLAEELATQRKASSEPEVGS